MTDGDCRSDVPRSTRLAQALSLCLIASGSATMQTASAAIAAAVTSCADSGPGTLRNAVTNAASGDTIDLTQLNCSSISLTSGEIVTDKNLVLHGPGAAALKLDANNLDRVLLHTGNGQISLYGLTLTRGRATFAGGCIYSQTSVYLKDSILVDCGISSGGSIAKGGGAYTYGNLKLRSSMVTQSFVHGNNSRGGSVYAHGNLVMRDSTLSGNDVRPNQDNFAYGGGGFVHGDVDISGSTISGNTAGYALFPQYHFYGNVAGLVISGNGFTSAKIVNSTISGNAASHAIGGLYSNAPLTLANSTIAYNTAGIYGINHLYFAGGLQLYYTVANIRSTIIFNNTVPDPDPMYSPFSVDISGQSASVSGAGNLILHSLLTLPGDTIHDPPVLGPLQNNGGLTSTHALGAGSAAIGNGNNSQGLIFDQRGPGQARVFARKVDIGAFQSGDAIFAAPFEPPG